MRLTRHRTVLVTVALLAGLSACKTPAATEAAPPPAEPEPWSRPDGSFAAPTFAPDGSAISFEAYEDFRPALYIAPGVELAFEPREQVPESMSSASRYGAGARQVREMAWSVEGPYLFAYTVQDESRVSIYVDNWSGMVGYDPSADGSPDWDPTAARFVFVSARTGHGDLYLWDGDSGGDELQLTYDERNPALDPVFAPDGQYVAYARFSPTNPAVLVLDVNMFVTEVVAEQEGRTPRSPSWDPDGARIAWFASRPEAGAVAQDLWVTDARPGSTPQLVAEDVRRPTRRGAPWTPDGEGLVAATGEGEICVFAVEGGVPDCLDLETVDHIDPDLAVIDDTWRLVFAGCLPEELHPDLGKCTSRELLFADIPR